MRAPQAVRICAKTILYIAFWKEHKTKWKRLLPWYFPGHVVHAMRAHFCSGSGRCRSSLAYLHVLRHPAA